jgi:hypothetical protein
VTDLDPELAEKIRASVDERITAQIQAARKRIVAQRDTRAAFAENRRAGVQHRNAAREARIRLAENHDRKEALTMHTIKLDSNDTLPEPLQRWVKLRAEQGLPPVCWVANHPEGDRSCFICFPDDPALPPLDLVEVIGGSAYSCRTVRTYPIKEK